MEKVLAENVKRICKAQNRQLKELASDMGIDPASLTRAIYGNASMDRTDQQTLEAQTAGNSTGTRTME